MKRLEKIKLLTIYFYKNFIRSKTGRSIYYFIIIFLIFLNLTFLSKNPEKFFIDICNSIVFTIIFFLSIFGSCQFISAEIKENTIQLLFTKPLKSSEIILSKWISLNLVIINTLIIYLILSHIFAFILFKKYYITLDLSFLTIFFASLLLSSFSFFLCSLYPSFSTAVFIIIFGSGLIDFLLKSLMYIKTKNLYELLAKKAGVYILYFLFYLLPSYQTVILQPKEILLDAKFFYSYIKYLLYVILCTAFYIFISIYIFSKKRRSYFKSI